MPEWIRSSLFVDEFDDHTVAALARYKPQLVPKGHVIFRPGDAAEGFVLLLSGRVHVYLHSASGRDLLLYEIAPGQTCMMTTLALLGSEPYQGEAVAETDLAAVIVPWVEFRRLMAVSDAFRTFVFKAFANRIGDMTSLLEMVAFQKIETRIAGWLLDHVDQNGRVLVSHADIATAIGSAREVVSRQVERLVDRGILKSGRREVVVVDLAALQALAPKVE